MSSTSISRRPKSIKKDKHNNNKKNIDISMDTSYDYINEGFKPQHTPTWHKRNKTEDPYLLAN